MSYTGCVFHCVDYQKRIVVFENSNYNKHKQRHAELEQTSFLPDRVKSALQDPTLIVRIKTRNVICYYLEEFEINGIIKYTKVVVHEQPIMIDKQTVFVIKTAFRTDHIQEKKYNYPLEHNPGATS